MLTKVVRPDGEEVRCTYDALGRRLSKTFQGKTTRWVWDGNHPLHEWVEPALEPEEVYESPMLQLFMNIQRRVSCKYKLKKYM